MSEPRTEAGRELLQRDPDDRSWEPLILAADILAIETEAIAASAARLEKLEAVAAAFLRVITDVHSDEAHQFDSGAVTFRECPEITCQTARAALDRLGEDAGGSET